MPLPESREEQLAFIRRVLALTGWSQTVLAKRAGLDPSTLSRFLAPSRDHNMLRNSTISRIGEVTGLRAEDVVDVPPSPALAEEAVPVSESGNDIIAMMLNQYRTRYKAVDAWRLNNRALELAGYQPGDILFLALDELPLAGDVVCAQLYDFAKQKAVSLFRLYHPPYLVASSTDAALVKPLPADGTGIVVKGVVVGSFRQRRPLAGP